MNWFINLKVGVKLIASFIVMAAIIGFVGMRGLKFAEQADHDFNTLYADRVVCLHQIGLTSEAFQHLRLVRMELPTLLDNPAEFEKVKSKGASDIQTIETQMEDYSKTYLVDKEKELLAAFTPAWRLYRSQWDSYLRELENTSLPMEERSRLGIKGAMDPETRKNAGDVRATLSGIMEVNADVARETVTKQNLEFHQQSRLITVILVISVIFALAAGIFLTRIITRPLGAVVKAMGDLAEGRLALPNLDPNRKDELGALSAAALRTVENLRGMIASIKQTSGQVATAADEISASSVQIARGAEEQASSTEETSSTIVEMASQIDSVAKAAQTLATGVDQTSSSVQEMGASIQQVAKNGENLLSSVEETSSTIEQMTASIKSVATRVMAMEETSRDAMRVATDGGKELSSVITGIGNSSKDIGKIVKIIEEIADQTNLLALNAAIEAARAGEAGKGFAVVAEEVKRLAERSMNSTREISNFVESVQKDVGQAVGLTQTVLKQMLDSVSKTNSVVGEVFMATQEQGTGAAQVLKTSTNMQHVTRELATAATEQAKGAKEIMKAVESMNRQTQQVADATIEQKKGGDAIVKAVDQIAQVSRQNLTATEQLSKATVNLAKEAEHLQKMAEQFSF